MYHMQMTNPYLPTVDPEQQPRKDLFSAGDIACPPHSIVIFRTRTSATMADPRQITFARRK